jgi:hypothetical protein
MIKYNPSNKFKFKIESNIPKIGISQTITSIILKSFRVCKTKKQKKTKKDSLLIKQFHKSNQNLEESWM